MDSKQAEKLVVDAAIGDARTRKLPCVKAFRLAKEHDIPIAEIGRICNARGIKISQCQLGCFS